MTGSPAATTTAVATTAAIATRAMPAVYDTVESPITAEAPYKSLFAAAGDNPGGGGDTDTDTGTGTAGRGGDGSDGELDLITQLAAYLGTFRGDTTAFDLDLTTENPAKAVADSAGFRTLIAHLVAKVRAADDITISAPVAPATFFESLPRFTLGVSAAFSGPSALCVVLVGR